jgi:glycerol-3-phosphate cytidylyltransferase
MMLKESRDNCDKLIVGLQNDPTLDRPDKNKPVQSYFERYIQLEAIKYVDEICPYETEEDLMKLLRYIRPDIRFIGEDWEGKMFTGIGLGIKTFYNKRYGYSTSELRNRLKL